jgi:hypothetical protein
MDPSPELRLNNPQTKSCWEISFDMDTENLQFELPRREFLPYTLVFVVDGVASILPILNYNLFTTGYTETVRNGNFITGIHQKSYNRHIFTDIFYLEK